MDRVDPLHGRELLAHRQFVRALAQQLVRDAATADDVTQDAMTRLLEVGRPTSIRPWLRSVVRNVARRFGRSERRRAEIEGGGAAGSAAGEASSAPATDLLAARLELQRRLSERVLALEPRARDIVMLHFYEGRTVAETARQLGIPLETARTRLRRALAELRTNWNGELGGDREGLAGLVLLARWTPAKGLVAAAGVTVGTGVVAMAIPSKLATVPVLATATLLVVVATGAFLLLRGGDPAKSSRAPLAASAASNATAAAAASDGSVLARPALAVAPQREAETPPAPAVAPHGTLVVHVHYAGDHAAATGVMMKVGRSGGEWRVDVRRALTDTTGTVRFDALAPGRHFVMSDRADDGTRAEVRAGETTAVEFAIPAGLTLTGLVVDPSGAPVPDALVEVAPLARADFDAEVLATTDEEGRFDVRAAPTLCLVGARAAGFTASGMKYIAGKDGNEANVRLELGPGGGVVDGVVVGPDGKPVAATVVQIGAGSPAGIFADAIGAPPLPALVRSDAQGRFHAVGVKLGKQPVMARAAGLAPFRGECDVVADVPTKLQVTLAAAATVHGVVRDAAGQVAPNTELNVGDWNDFVHLRTVTGTDGSFEFTGLPIGTVRIDAQHDQLGKASREVLTVAGSDVPCELRLLRGLELKGRVVDEAGAPVAGARVEAMAGQWFTSGASDESGRFALANCPESGTVTLNFSVAGNDEEQRSDVDPKAGEVELVAHRTTPPSARLTGVVVGPDGKPVANAQVIAIGVVPATTHQVWPTGPDGRFDLGPLAPGAWRVMVRGTAFPGCIGAPHEVAAHSTCEVGTIRLSAGGWADVTVEGDRSNANFRVLDAEGSCLSWPEVVGDGRQLRTEPLAPGDYRLLVYGRGIASQTVPFTIRADTPTPVALELHSGIRQKISIDLENEWKTPTGVAIRVVRNGELVLSYSLFAHQDQPASDELWLAPGDYALTASAAGHEGRATFTVGGDERPAVAVEMK